MKTNNAFLSGQRHFLRGEYGLSIASFSNALASGMDPAMAHLPLGLAHFKNYNFSRAIESYGYALEHDPRNEKVLFLRGMALFNNEELGRALEDFDAVLCFNPGHASTHVARSLVLRALHRNAEAEEALKTAIAIGGVEAELFIREYCLTPHLQGLALSLFDAYKAGWGRHLRAERMESVH
jgi:tetratricopeptide (TPR) repeat protein